MKHRLFFTLRIFFFLFILFSFTLFSQQLSYKNFTVKDGLPSSVVYSVIQDSKGFLWFTTEAGVSKFDGTSFQNYSTADGLSDNDVLDVYKDTKGGLWFLTFSGVPTYYLNGKFSSLKILFKKIQPALIETFFEDSKGNIWLSTKKTPLIKYTKGKIKKISSPGLRNSVLFYKENIKDETLWVISDSLYFININTDKISKGIPMRYSDGTGIQKSSFSRIIKTKEKYTGIKNLAGVFELKDSVITPVIPLESIMKNYKINSASQYNNDLWISTGAGVVCFPNTVLTKNNKKLFLEGYNVSNVYRDHEGSIWFTTLGRGVFYLPSEEIINYTLKDNLPEEAITCINGDGKGNILIGTGNGMISKISNGKVQPVFDKQYIKGNKIYDILVTPEGTYFAGTGVISPGKNPVGSSSIKALTGSPGKTMYAAASNGLYKITGRREINIGPSLGLSRTTSVYLDKSDKLWIGSNGGLYSLRNDSLIYYGDKNPLLKGKVTDINSTNDGTVWVATYENGIIGIKDTGYLHISVHNGLHSNMCKSIYTDRDDNLWAATNKGAHKITFGSGKSSFSTEHYSTIDGLISDEVTGIYKENDKVWVATLSGISVFKESRFKKSFPAPAVYITGINKYRNDTLLPEKITLTHRNNDLIINYIGLSYGSRGNTTYKYLLEGHMKNSAYTSSTQAQFYSLPPGNYSFHVYARNAKGVWSKAPASIDIEVLPAFYQTWWFKMLFGVIFLTAGFLVFRMRVNNIQMKERQKTVINKKLAELKLTALRAQMNPHFIFNSLTSIRRFINKNDPESAEKYITDFAHLLRLILNNSDKEFICLEDEIKMLNAYLEFEALRFSNRFEYSIEASPDIRDIEIPPLLIQPYIENTIQHGFAHLTERKGVLKIYFNLEEDMLKCTIEDNGIGRKKAMEIKSEQRPGYTSKGMTISHDRLETLNLLKPAEMKVEVTDLKNNGEPAGTKVVIFIPV